MLSTRQIMRLKWWMSIMKWKMQEITNKKWRINQIFRRKEKIISEMIKARMIVDKLINRKTVQFRTKTFQKEKVLIMKGFRK